MYIIVPGPGGRSCWSRAVRRGGEVGGPGHGGDHVRRDASCHLHQLVEVVDVHTPPAEPVEDRGVIPVGVVTVVPRSAGANPDDGGPVVDKVGLDSIRLDSIKLDRVGPVDNRPSPEKLHHFVEKIK